MENRNWKCSFREKLERECEVWLKLVLIPDTPTGKVIYCHNWNEEKKPTVVSEVNEVAGINRDTIAPKTEPYSSALLS